MTYHFDDLATLNLDGHVQRWSPDGVRTAQGDVNDWLAAAQMFAARTIEAAPELDGPQWLAVSDAWLQLLAAAESSVGKEGLEWQHRDHNLTSVLLQKVGPRAGVPLRDPARLLDSVLDLMPMDDPATARELGPRWRELSREQIIELRMIKMLVAPTRPVRPLLNGLPRARELDAWLEVCPLLP
ncbi:hypothetical protein ADK70_18505 [Streptomyces rimosus subsp. pseudoverticillatus]|uniref:hypothetical protein n=1 Tax=Streptomyces rimosus TaxID=1927 RepID=UPI0006B2A6BD|nr:hypothetical protein [Streptomyces rimosus]KOT89305.1 hypothetical protein ADK70_18505 [Streptomyces rimosus subsp. pseudoverticillatus]